MPQTRGRLKPQRACPWCPRTFSKEEHLSRHIRSHTKEKPFTCAECGKSFSRHDTLLRHARAHPSYNTPQSGPIATPPTTGATGNVSSIHQAPSTSDVGSLHPDESIFFNVNRPAPPRLPAWLETFVDPPTEFVDQRQIQSQESTFTPLEGMLQNPSAIQWDTDLDAQVPNWLAGEDFDLNALNSSVLASAINDIPLLVCHDDDTPVWSLSNPPINVDEDREEYHTRQHWFSFIPAGDTGHATPDMMPERTEVDDQYREGLSKCLQQRVMAEPLPSTEFLNQCVQMYFTRFSPIFPVVHPSTFRPSPKHSLLLLSICSVGSLFVGSNYAIAQGSRIFERLHKAILASWEKYFAKGKEETLAMIQAALIGQTFAILSGNPRHLLIAQTFHGTVVNWARRCKMFQVRQADDLLPGGGLSVWTMEQRWKSWAHAEEQVRVATGLYIQDTELSTLLMSRPVLKHSSSVIPVTSSDSLWGAKSITGWNALNEERKATTPSKSQFTEMSGFTQFTMLEGLIASVVDNRSLNTGHREDVREQFERWLSQFYDNFLKENAPRSSSPFCLELLWHSAYLALFVDFDRLELATGRDGYAESLPHLDYIQKWACSQDGRRCALHGALVLRKAQDMTLGIEPAIHVPRVLYQAAMVWFAYLKFGVDNHDSPKDFSELTCLNVNCQALLFESNGFKISRPKIKESSTLSGLVDLLRRIGHWGISRKFADQLVWMMQGNTEDEPSNSTLL